MSATIINFEKQHFHHDYMCLITSFMEHGNLRGYLTKNKHRVHRVADSEVSAHLFTDDYLGTSLHR